LSLLSIIRKLVKWG
jgi:hypothetical protein